MNMRISQIREFINKETPYVLMLSFIFIVNAWAILDKSFPETKKGANDKKAITSTQEKESEEKTDEEILADDKDILRKVLTKPGPHLKLMHIIVLVGTFLFALGLFLDIRIVMAGLRKKRIFNTIAEHPRVGWDILDVFRLIIIFTFLGYAIQIIDSRILSSFFPKINIKQFSSVLKTGILDIALLGFVIYFVRVKYGQNLAAMGLKIKNITKNIYLAFLSYIAFIPILMVLLMLLMWLSTVFEYDPPQQVMFKLFFREKKTWFLVFGTFLAVIVGPIVEEIFFRGFSYNAIKKKWGVHVAAALTAIVFAGLHSNLIGFLPIMALGFLLAYMYEKTGSLIPSITIHILHNTLMVSLLLFGRYLVHLAQ